MRCLVTCGPTYEPLDKVRRLTNFSTGKLGIGLANFLLDAGHNVTLLKGYYAICPDGCRARSVTFTTTQDLLDRFREAAKERYDAVFHAAAVSDFAFGSVYRRSSNGELTPVEAGKFRTGPFSLLAELVSTPKIIGELRDLFPSSILVGWKYEVDGDKISAVAAAREQLFSNRTDFCVVNGPAYGNGYGILPRSGAISDCSTAETLYPALLEITLEPTSS